MVAKVTIHFEGAPGLKPGFHSLLGQQVQRARQRRTKFEFIAGGSREKAVKDFLRSCRQSPSNLNVLLVDSEGPVQSRTSWIRALRGQSFWDGGVACSDEQVNLMVQSMEAWFIADPQAIARHFSQGYNGNSLPSPQNAERTAPADMLAAISRGIPRDRRGRRRRYDKVTDGAHLLELIDVATIGRHCRHFKRLMDFLDKEIDG